MKLSYNTSGVCATKVDFEIEDDKVKSVKFLGGCDGNHQGISRLIEGMQVDDAIKRLSGITCGYRSTSCPDQLAEALKKYRAENK